MVDSFWSHYVTDCLRQIRGGGSVRRDVHRAFLPVDRGGRRDAIRGSFFSIEGGVEGLDVYLLSVAVTVDNGMDKAGQADILSVTLCDGGRQPQSLG